MIDEHIVYAHPQAVIWSLVVTLLVAESPMLFSEVYWLKCILL